MDRIISLILVFLSSVTESLFRGAKGGGGEDLHLGGGGGKNTASQ